MSGCVDAVAGIWCCRALACCSAFACALAASNGVAASLAEKARESGCNSKPVAISSGLYKCVTASGSDAFFNLQGSGGGSAASTTERSVRRSDSPVSPPGFPRVDAETQKGRDDLRRKVLSDELSAEEKFLADARTAYGNGAPAPLPEEQADAEKYRQRISRLRQAVQLHERNIEALKKELGNMR
ncbi:MAG TPA: hypothetical protein VGL25_04250 [Casimicrobiaceae bacterium]|jgi:hypothetical protein